MNLQSPPFPSQIYPRNQYAGAKSLESQKTEAAPVKQPFGHALAVMGAIGGILVGIFCFFVAIIKHVSVGDLVLDIDHPILRISWVIVGFGYNLIGVFYALAAFLPEYIGGNPSFIKLLPHTAGFACIIWGRAYFKIVDGISIDTFLSSLIPIGAFFAVSYFLYLGNDDSGYFLLYFKPWIIKSSTSVNLHQQTSPPLQFQSQNIDLSNFQLAPPAYSS